MAASPDDWRRMGQEDFLPPGTRLAYQSYEASVDSWETEHCLFCFTPFLAERVKAANARLKDRSILTAGYTTTAEHREGVGAHWVCAPCMADFAEEYQLVPEGGPSAG